MDGKEATKLGTTIAGICATVIGVFAGTRIPATILPSSLVYAGSLSKPGISPMMVASRIISRQQEAGAPYGPMPDGSANVAEAMEVIRVEEIIKAIHDDGQVQVSLPPGSVVITATGGNAGGPVTVVGTNTNFVSGVGTMV